jgi:hypothetical protein
MGFRDCGRKNNWTERSSSTYVAKHIYNQPNEAAWLQPDACHHHILQEATTEAARRTNSGLLDCQKKPPETRS